MRLLLATTLEYAGFAAQECDEIIMTIPAGLADRFMALYGAPPAGIWSAPGRANLIGEHTDYNNGFVLPFAIDARTWCAARPNDAGALRVASTAQPSQHRSRSPTLTRPSLRGGQGTRWGWRGHCVKMGHDLSVRAGPRHPHRLDRPARRRTLVVGRARIRGGGRPQ